MNRSLRIAVLTSFIPLIAASFMPRAIARPYPDRLGICYRFQDDTLDHQEPCVISTGYGAGAHYTVLHWSDDTNTAIYLMTACTEQEYDDRGFCGYQMDEEDAEPYERNIFFDITTEHEPDNIPCYRAIASDESVCYQFSG